MSAEDRETRRVVMAMATIIAIGAALRLFQLSAQSLWIDEVSQLQSALDVASSGWGVVAQRDNVAPLSHWILWGFVSLLGVSESVIRLPSVIAGTVAIYLAYRLGQTWFSSQVGVVAAAIVAISPFALWHAQDGRMYALSMSLSAWALVAFSSAMHGCHRARHWVALTVATALGLYTHQYAALISVPCGIFVLWHDGLFGERTRRWMATQLIAAIAFLPWLIHSFDRLGATSGFVKDSALIWAPYAIFTFLFGYSLGPPVRELHWDASVAALSPYLVQIGLATFGFALAILGVRNLLRGPKRSSTVLASLCVFTPLGLAMLAPAVSDISFNVRYAAVSFPAFVVLAAAAVLNLGKARISMLLGVAYGIGALCSIYGWYVNPVYGKTDFRTASTYLASRVESEELVILSSSTTDGVFAFYGFQPKERVLISRYSLEEALARVGQLKQGRVWLVESRSWESDPQQRLHQDLASRGTVDIEEAWTGVTVRRYSL